MSPTSLEELEVKGADLKAALARIGFLPGCTPWAPVLKIDTK